MNIVNICPTCHKSISRARLVDIIVTYREDLAQAEIYEQGWHKECYPPAPALIEACEAIQEAFRKGEIKFTKIRQADSDPYHPANIKLAAAIAAAKGKIDD